MLSFGSWMRSSNFCLKAVRESIGVQPASIASSMSYSQVYQVSRSLVSRGRSVTLLRVNISILLVCEEKPGEEQRMVIYCRNVVPGAGQFRVRRKIRY